MLTSMSAFPLLVCEISDDGEKKHIHAVTRTAYGIDSSRRIMI